ncbi:MAG: hypothetical protein Q9218_007530, partial [Villophora microphyllina]
MNPTFAAIIITNGPMIKTKNAQYAIDNANAFLAEKFAQLNPLPPNAKKSWLQN